MQAFGEAHQRELRRRVGQHVRHSKLSTDGRDVYDGRAAPPTAQSILPLQMGQGRPRRVERRKEVDPHGVFKVLGGHRLDWPHLDHAGVVYEHVNAAKVPYSFEDQPLALGGLRQVGGDQIEVLRLQVRMALQKLRLRGLQLVPIARRKHKPHLPLRKPRSNRQAKPA